MRFVLNEKARRVARPASTLIALLAAIWHLTHAMTMWQQARQYSVSDPPLSRFFWNHVQIELLVALIAFFAGGFAWHLFRPKKATE